MLRPQAEIGWTKVVGPETQRRRLSRPRPAHRLLRAFYDAESYGLVLLLILVSYLLSVTVTSSRAHAAVLAVQMTTVWLVFRTSEARHSVIVATNVLLALSGIVAVAGLLALPGAGSNGVLFAVSSALYFVAPIAIVRHIVRRRVVDQETVLGAIAAYLLIGMFFAFVYRWVGQIQDGAFFGPGGEGTIAQDLFFSFTTMTTVGYGNLIPGGNPGQTIAVFEALTGQLFLVIAVAKAVSSWQPGVGRGGASAPADDASEASADG
jgi:hypothetical protein